MNLSNSWQYRYGPTLLKSITGWGAITGGDESLDEMRNQQAIGFFFINTAFGKN